jgi:arginase family enzyme
MAVVSAFQNHNMINAIKEMFKDKTVHVYITVDRDVFKGVETHYNPGRYNWPDIDTKAGELIKALSPVKFVGFDITGLVPADKYDATQYARAISDVKFFRGWAERLIQKK